MGGNPWAAEIGRFVALLAGALVLGQLAGHPLEALLVAALAYAASLLLQLHRLERWIRAGKKSHPPPARGIWSELYQQVHRLHLRARKRKRKLANALKRLRQSVAAFPDAAVILDGEDGIEWFNAGAGRLLGLKMPEDLGQRVTNLVRHPLFQDFLEGRGEPGAIEIPSPEDEHLVLSITLIRYGADQRLLLARDVSHLARLEQVRRDFVANVSHELRTPMARIRLALALAEEGDVARARQALAEIGDDLGELERLVEEILAAARLDLAGAGGLPLHRAPLDARALVEDAAARFRARHEARVLDLTVAEPLPAPAADAALLRRLLGNLLDNAAKYSDAAAPVTLSARAEGGALVLEVRDRGIGVADEDLPRLFTPFFRTDRSRARGTGGVGLGLALARRIAEAHGGQVTAARGPEAGMVFRVTLPAGDPPPAA